MNLQAHLEPLSAASRDRRETARRKLKFGAELAREGAGVVVSDLSTGGLRFETSAELECGEAIDVVLPHRGATKAVVVWRDGRSYGGEFTQPVSAATVSAALLRSEPAAGQQRPFDGATEGVGARAGERSAAAAGRTSRNRIGRTLIISAALLVLGLAFVLPIGAVTAVAAIVTLTALLVMWGNWVLDNSLQL